MPKQAAKDEDSFSVSYRIMALRYKVGGLMSLGKGSSTKCIV